MAIGRGVGGLWESVRVLRTGCFVNCPGSGVLILTSPKKDLDRNAHSVMHTTTDERSFANRTDVHNALCHTHVVMCTTIVSNG